MSDLLPDSVEIQSSGHCHLLELLPQQEYLLSFSGNDFTVDQSGFELLRATLAKGLETLLEELITNKFLFNSKLRLSLLNASDTELENLQILFSQSLLLDEVRSIL